jgi:hypothetical protein
MNEIILDPIESYNERERCYKERIKLEVNEMIEEDYYNSQASNAYTEATRINPYYDESNNEQT